MSNRRCVSMSYHDGRSSILGGSPEPGLSSVIKVNRRSSYNFRWNEERLIFLFSSGTCPTRSLVRCSDPNCSLNCCYDRYHSVNLIKVLTALAFFPQRLEDQHLNGDPGAKSPTVPTKIRDIVTKSISPVDSKMASPGFGDESRMLQSEVSRLEDLLAATRAERDEIGSKYMAVSDKVRKTS